MNRASSPRRRTPSRERVEVGAPARPVVRVRPAEPGDLAVVHRLVAALATHEGADPPHPVAFARTFERSLAPGSAFRFLVADSGGRVVGACSVHDRFSTWQGAPVVDVQDVYVVPEERRRGVASALLAAAEAHATRLGAARVELQVLAGNAHAHALYRRDGYVETGYVVLRKRPRKDDDAELRGVFGDA